MKHLIAAVMMAALLLTGATAAMADVLGVYADLPLQMEYSASDLSADSVEGYIVGFTTPFFLGIALEDYKVGGKVEVGSSKLDFTQNTTFTDLYVDIPFPILNLSLGYGVGTAAFELDDDIGVKFDNANLTQYYVSAGIPIALLFDVHVGYRVISGTADVKSGGSGEADLDANLVSLGIKVGF